MRNLLHVPAILLHWEIISDKMSFCTATMQYSNNTIPPIKIVTYTLTTPTTSMCVYVCVLTYINEYFNEVGVVINQSDMYDHKPHPLIDHNNLLK